MRAVTMLHFMSLYEFLTAVLATLTAFGGFLWANRQSANDLKEIEVLSEVRAKYNDRDDTYSVREESDKRIKYLLTRRTIEVSEPKQSKGYWWGFGISGSVFVGLVVLMVWLPTISEPDNAWPTLGLLVAFAASPIAALATFWFLRQANKFS